MSGPVGTNLCTSATELVDHRSVFEETRPTPLLDGFILDAMGVINADRSVRVRGPIPQNGWEEELCYWKPGKIPLSEQ